MKLLNWYIENSISVVKTQWALKVFYKTKKAPDKNKILDIAINMEQNGCVGRRVYSKRAKTARTPENIKRIKKKLEHSPHCSSRRLEKETGISRYTVRRILNNKQHQITFMQDGAPPHHATTVKDWQQKTFNGRVIGHESLFTFPHIFCLLSHMRHRLGMHDI